MRGLFTILISIFFLQAGAQIKIIQGYIKDSVTHQPVVLASITNLNSAKTVLSSETGLFKIAASDNEVLSLAAVGYYLDTLDHNRFGVTTDTLVLFMVPIVTTLQNVTVSTKGYSQYQYDSIERRRSFLKDVGGNKISTVSESNSGAGFALNLDHFSKREKAKRKAYDFFDYNEKEAYINYFFTPELVKEYTGLKGDSLQLFMQLYRPNYNWLRVHTVEDVKYDINTNLSLFFKRKDQ